MGDEKGQQSMMGEHGKHDLVQNTLQVAACKLTEYAKQLRRSHRCTSTGEWDCPESHAEFAECMLVAFHLRLLNPTAVASRRALVDRMN
jgi:hypothetical protein